MKLLAQRLNLILERLEFLGGLDLRTTRKWKCVDQLISRGQRTLNYIDQVFVFTQVRQNHFICLAGGQLARPIQNSFGIGWFQFADVHLRHELQNMFEVLFEMQTGQESSSGETLHLPNDFIVLEQRSWMH
jgi:hypothetical protein